MTIFISDGTLDGFFTAVFDAYKIKDSTITSALEVQLTLDSEIVKVKPDLEKSRRIKVGLQRYDNSAVNDISLALRSCDPLKEQTAFEYIKLIFENKRDISTAYNLPQVILFDEMRKRVTTEIHRFKGFLRFMENEDGTMYAPYSPDNDITMLLMPHFVARFKNQKFVIHDIKRKIAAIYNGVEWIIGYVGDVQIYLSQYEKSFETLWKKYYKSVNIAARPHEKQMRGYMPARYWEFMPEKTTDDE